MSTLEAASASAGPRYAPEDPSLPKPWVGLIDGGSGVLYFWNPETNVTQYEKPVPSSATPLPQPATAPHVPVPHSSQPQQTQPQHPAQHMLSHVGQQMPQQLTQQPNYHQMQPTQQQAYHQNAPHETTQQQTYHQMQPTQQQTYHQMPPSQGHQYQYQQHMMYQQSMPPQAQRSVQQQNQYSIPGEQFSNQQTPLPKRDEFGSQQGNVSGLPPSQYHLRNNSMTGVQSSQPQQFVDPSHNMQKANSNQSYGPSFQNEMGPSPLHDQRSHVPPVGLKMGYENNELGRVGNNYHLNTKWDAPAVSSNQPNLASIPRPRHQKEMRMDDVPFKSITPANAVVPNLATNSTHNMYNPAAGGQTFPGNALVRPPLVGASDVSLMSPAELYCQQHEVTTTGDNIPAPFMTFEATGFPPELLRDMHSAGFLSPTPIQAQTWPIALQSRDIVATAKTGSGKTLGYLIPAFILLLQCRNNSQYGPTVLVLAPTRELATQIQDEAVKFGRSSQVSCTCLYGGAPKGPQLQELERGADIVVATPGRLNDILEMKRISFGQVSLLVLDEADRMLDMGFEPQIRKIVKEIPPRRQTLMFTATWPKEVRKIASDLLVNPVQVNIGNVDELVANKSITQYVEVVRPMEKERRLEQILQAQERGSKVIVFCSTKRLCDQLARGIGRNFGAIAIHGDKSQNERDWVLNQFRSGQCPVLVATDVAARGLDIKDIRIVINYDFPTGIEDYVHRIGRTGRAGATGVSYTFLAEQDWKHVADLIKILEGANQHVPPEVRQMALHRGPIQGKDRGGFSRFGSDRPNVGGGHWDSGGHGGVREGGYGGHGRMRDSNFANHGGMRDGNFGGRGGIRDASNFGGRGGMRDIGNFGGHDGTRQGGSFSSAFSGQGNQGHAFGGAGGGHVGWGRNERGSHGRFNNKDGRGRGRGRFDGRSNRARGRNSSRSPDRVQTRDYGRTRSRSRSWSRGRSRSRSWSRSRSRSYSRSPRRSSSRSRSRSPSPIRNKSPSRNKSHSCSSSPTHNVSRSPHRTNSCSQSPKRDQSDEKFEVQNEPAGNGKDINLANSEASRQGMLAMSSRHGTAFSGEEQLPAFEGAELGPSLTAADPGIQSGHAE